MYIQLPDRDIAAERIELNFKCQNIIDETMNAYRYHVRHTNTSNVKRHYRVVKTSYKRRAAYHHIIQSILRQPHTLQDE